MAEYLAECLVGGVVGWPAIAIDIHFLVAMSQYFPVSCKEFFWDLNSTNINGLEADLYMADLVGTEIRLISIFVISYIGSQLLHINFKQILSFLLINWYIGFKDLVSNSLRIYKSFLQSLFGFGRI